MGHQIKGNDSRIPGYVANILVHIVFLYIIFKLPTWFHFLRSDFSAVAWLLYISYSATILVNFIYIFFDNSIFKSISQVALNIFSIIIFYTLLKLFPFSLDDSQQMIARIVIYVIIFGTTIGALVEISRFFKLLANGGEEIISE